MSYIPRTKYDSLRTTLNTRHIQRRRAKNNVRQSHIYSKDPGYRVERRQDFSYWVILILRRFLLLLAFEDGGFFFSILQGGWYLGRVKCTD